MINYDRIWSIILMSVWYPQFGGVELVKILEDPVALRSLVSKIIQLHGSRSMMTFEARHRWHSRRHRVKCHGRILLPTAWLKARHAAAVGSAQGCSKLQQFQLQDFVSSHLFFHIFSLHFWRFVLGYKLWEDQTLNLVLNQFANDTRKMWKVSFERLWPFELNGDHE